MRRRKLEANMLIYIDNININKNGVPVLTCRDTKNNILEISTYIEKDETVKSFVKNEYRPATKEDWSNYLISLVENRYKEKELLEEFENNITKESNNISGKMLALMEKQMAGEILSTEEMTDLQKLSARKKEITEIQNNPEKYLADKKDEIQKQIDNKKLFLFGGINRVIKEDGKVYYSAELPHPGKAKRNIKSPLSGIITEYTLLNGDKPLTIGEVQDPNFNYENVSLKASLCKNNDKETIETVFQINENAIDKILNNEMWGKTIYEQRLLDLLPTNELSKAIVEFKKENNFENLSFEKIEELKELYEKVKVDVLANGMDNYNIDIKIIIEEESKLVELKSLAQQFTNSLSKSFLTKLLYVKEDGIPKELKLEEIIAIQSIPTNIVNGVNLADQFYLKKSFGPNIFAPALESDKTEMFGSVKISEQIDGLCGIEIKKKDIQESEQEVEDVNGMER